MSTIDSLADDIMAGLQEYVSLANDSMKEAVKKTATSVKKEISANAPKDTGAYGKSKPYFSTFRKKRAFVRKLRTKARLSQKIHCLSILAAISSAIFIMLVKVVCRSSAESSSPVTRLSEMEQMASARLPV